MREPRRCRFLVWPAMALMYACASNPSVSPEQEAVAGMVPLPARSVDTVLVAPGASLSNYKRVILDSVDVEFKEGWERGSGMSADDITRIRSQASAAFYEAFGFALSANDGYPLTTHPAADVLRVSARISDLEIAKFPADTATQRPSYVVSSADLMLLMDLRDSTSGALVVRVMDRGRGRVAGDMHIEDSVANSSEARRALEKWAQLLREALDDARSRPAGQAGQ